MQSRRWERSWDWRWAALALAVAVELHVAVILAWTGSTAATVVVATAAEPAFVVVPLELTVVSADSELVMPRPGPLAAPLVPVWGAGDSAGFDERHPLPEAALDLPGSRAAGRGGGSPGGTDSWTGRDDGQELRAQSWNHPDSYRLARERTARDRATERNSLVRDERRGFDDRTERQTRRARAGHSGPVAGAGAAATTRGEPDGPPSDDGVVLPEPGPARVRGTVQPVHNRVLAEVGTRSTDADQRGPTRDSVDSSAASNERTPRPFDLTRPRSGGPAEHAGVAGSHDDGGVVALGLRNSAGSAALRASVARGVGVNATQAHSHNPYFRKMYRRLDAVVEYPKELALSLDQGEVIVAFTILADGRVIDVNLEKSSGFDAFDRQVTRAIALAAPFGPVPRELLGARDRLRVRAPYAFRNPWIR